MAREGSILGVITTGFLFVTLVIAILASVDALEEALRLLYWLDAVEKC